jgi:2-oxoglutarate ferredoxin oxidoreductase subunit delta
MPNSGEQGGDLAKIPGTRQPMDLDQARIPLGQVHVIPERCKECGYCVGFCPEQVLAFSEESNSRGYHYPVIAAGQEEACVHCGYCNLICPELAIYTAEIPRPAASSAAKED